MQELQKLTTTMIWRLPTCSSGFVFLFCIACTGWSQVTVSGRVTLTDSNSTRSKREYSDVAVWLEPVNRSSIRVVSRKHAVMLQKNKRFTPHLLVVESGTDVDFPNKDPIFHNAFSNYDGQIFDIGLYPPGSSRAVNFDRPGIVRVFCNIHSTMSAIIVVVDSSYYASTVTDGRFAINNVEPGDYVLNVFHERALPETLQHLKRRLTVASEPLNMGNICISEAGYLPSSHKNKYGRDYPEDSGISAPYTLGRR